MWLVDQLMYSWKATAVVAVCLSRPVSLALSVDLLSSQGGASFAAAAADAMPRNSTTSSCFDVL